MINPKYKDYNTKLEGLSEHYYKTIEESTPFNCKWKTVEGFFKDIGKFFSQLSHTRFSGSKYHFKGCQSKLKSFLDVAKAESPTVTDSGILNDLAKTKARSYLKYCSATIACFKQDTKWVEPFGFKIFNPKEKAIDVRDIGPNMQVKEDCFFDPSTGVKAIVLKNDEEVIICFGSIHTGTHEFRIEKPSDESKGNQAQGEIQIDTKGAARVIKQQDKVIYKNVLGGKSATFEQAHLLFQKLKTLPEFKDKKITLTGQCFGGSLASYAALKDGAHAVCFNTFPLGAGQQAEIDQKMLQEADEYVTHISAETDFVSDNRFLAFGNWLLSSLRIRTPGNFGQRYVIPSAYKDSNSTHSYIQGSFMKFLGYDVRTSPDQLKERNELLL